MFILRPIISDGNLLFVDYYQSNYVIINGGYKIPVADITLPVKQHTTWNTIIPSTFNITLVPNSSPPIAIGGYTYYSSQDADEDPKLKLGNIM